jgi:hypothetical protein
MIRQDIDIIDDIVTAVGDPTYARQYMLDFFCSINHCYKNDFSKTVIRQHAGRLRALAKLIASAGIELAEVTETAKEYFDTVSDDDLQWILNLIKAYYNLYDVYNGK